ncbi:MAG: hypothetical protein ACYTHK_05015 [Planctomycetota bacterium]
MRYPLGILLLLGAACSTVDHEVKVPDVAVTASEEAEGIRVQFQLNKGSVTAHDFQLEIETGRLVDVCRSSDLRHVSVLWMDDDGKITCRFPYGQTGEWESGGELLKDHFDYVFYEKNGIRVHARIPRGAPMRPRLLLNVEVPETDLPATFQWKGREPRRLTKSSSFIVVQLPINERKVLATGDWDVTLTTKSGKFDFLIGVDKDGTPTASSGYVQRAP